MNHNISCSAVYLQNYPKSKKFILNELKTQIWNLDLVKAFNT